jgi:serine/threonine protein kinase
VGNGHRTLQGMSGSGKDASGGDGGHESSSASSSSSSSGQSRVRRREQSLFASSVSTRFDPTNQYFIEYQLGRGSHGVVYLARHRVNNELIALKVTKNIRNTRVEVNAISTLSHPNVLQIYNCQRRKDSNVIFVYLELCRGGELFNKIIASPTGRLQRHESYRYIRQLMSAVQYCHSRGVAHRDIKPENLLLAAGDQLKIADFGLAFLLNGESESATWNMAQNKCGTALYAAPEIWKGAEYNPFSADIWSVGIVLFCMLCGYPPFKRASDSCPLFRKFLDGKHSWPSHLVESDIQLLSNILRPDPTLRWTSLQILKHSLLQKDAAVKMKAVALAQSRKSATAATPAAQQFVPASALDAVVKYLKQHEGRLTKTAKVSAPKVDGTAQDIANGILMSIFNGRAASSSSSSKLPQRIPKSVQPSRTVREKGEATSNATSSGANKPDAGHSAGSSGASSSASSGANSGGSGNSSSSSSTTGSGDNIKDRRSNGASDDSTSAYDDESSYKGPFSSKWAVNEVQMLLQNYKARMESSKGGGANFLIDRSYNAGVGEKSGDPAPKRPREPEGDAPNVAHGATKKRKIRGKRK